MKMCKSGTKRAADRGKGQCKRSKRSKKINEQYIDSNEEEEEMHRPEWDDIYFNGITKVKKPRKRVRFCDKVSV